MEGSSAQAASSLPVPPASLKTGAPSLTTLRGAEAACVRALGGIQEAHGKHHSLQSKGMSSLRPSAFSPHCSLLLLWWAQGQAPLLPSHNPLPEYPGAPASELVPGTCL